jgi:hypothetical protein
MKPEDHAFWKKVLFTSWLAFFVLGIMVGRKMEGF